MVVVAVVLVKTFIVVYVNALLNVSSVIHLSSDYQFLKDDTKDQNDSRSKIHSYVMRKICCQILSLVHSTAIVSIS